MTADGIDEGRHVIRIFRLGEEPRDDLREWLTVEERLRLLRRLSERAWALGGKPVVRVPRASMPVAIRRLE